MSVSQKVRILFFGIATFLLVFLPVALSEYNPYRIDTSNLRWEDSIMNPYGFFLNTSGVILFNSSGANARIGVDLDATSNGAATITLTRNNETPWYYTGYSPTLSVTNKGLTLTATQFYSRVANNSAQAKLSGAAKPAEIYSFWLGVYDEGEDAGNVTANPGAGTGQEGNGAVGGLIYNAMQGQNNRWIFKLGGVQTLTEISGSTNLHIGQLYGGRFGTSDDAGAGATINQTMNIILPAPGQYGKNNTQIYAPTLATAAGRTNYFIWQEGLQQSRFGGLVNATTGAWFGGKDNFLNISNSGRLQMNGTAMVYNDIQFPIASGKVPATNFPSWEAFTANTDAYAFSVGDYTDLAVEELPHWWAEGTPGDIHVHFAQKADAAADSYVNFTFWVAIANTTASVWSEPFGPLSQNVLITNGGKALNNTYLDVGDLNFGTYKIGSQLRIRVKRAAIRTGLTEYNNDVFITQVGVHLKQNTLGSFGETAK